MATPVLTKEQQKDSLSAKKKPREKCLRNVLAKPHLCKSPHPDNGTCNTLMELLKSVITSQHNRFRREVAQGTSESTSAKSSKKCLTNILKESGLRNLLFVGINAATRGLEKDEVRSLMIDKSVDPPIMISHVGALCGRNSVPHVVVANLRNVTNQAFGFPSIAVGLKKIAKTDNDPLLQLHDRIQDISKEFSDDNTREAELENEAKCSEGAVGQLSPPRQATLPESSNCLTTVVDSKLRKCSISEDELSDRKEENCKVTPTPSVEIYKYRKSIRERIFLPKKSKLDQSEFFAIVSCEESGLDDEPVIGISANFPINLKRKNISDHNQDYKPPVIKKLCPNPRKKLKK